MAAQNGKKRKVQQRVGTKAPPASTSIPTLLTESVYAESLKIFEKAVAQVFDRRRDYYVFSIVQELRKLGVSASPGNKTGDEDNQWRGIESLSQLRGLVGGRFQNIKAKWMAAGFPLKEHRGDKTDPYELNQEGWIELANWIMSQGFEARLAADCKESLFEIREIPSSE